ncbi:hypothetical protein BCR34DRAFT_496996 [Clohesyomyces aquaticus]|uniref:Peptidase C15, pyroglutamyl peptidase I-like protein n=1 Tax=Clohesyomyces aquaticus TaxID=1231657 RepID=A0A1Y1YH69_9PLEO|nr:hypothetical protein BCR34DRAFT_496996 [Clohesyomyces aquaticus]
MPRAWNSAARQPPPQKEEEPVTVLVTGFGPFLQKYPKNSSWEIASTLPALLPSTPTSPTPIHVHVHHTPVRVAYSHVVSFIPTLLPPANPITPAPSIILHIGLAAGRSFYTIERGAHGRGYGAIPDVDADRFDDNIAEEKFPRAVYPPRLLTSFDCEDVLGRWREYLGSNGEKQLKADVRISPDAGNFLCGFIYYNSLAHYFELKEDERPVAFLHVPDLSESEEMLNVGREVAVALIRALVESRRTEGVVDKSVDGGEQVVSGVDPRAGTDVNFQQG